MVFDSVPFLIFLPSFLAVYYLSRRNRRLQILELLLASYVFYGWWDWRFLGLLVFSSVLDYILGRALDSTGDDRRRKRILWISVLTNLGILFSFKYFDFFTESMQVALRSIGIDVGLPELRVILPVGISFYTFQSMSYIIDIYQRKIPAEQSLLVFMAYVAAFPQLVAGPIERADHLMGQIKHPNPVDAAAVREAVWLLCWGFFMKEAVADGIAPFVDMAFSETQTSGWMTVFGTIGFGIQIYCDFNAYSMIARGTGMLFGLHLMWNFRQPYFAASIQDFWRRWHISLSTWLRDYLYIPLGGNRRGRGRTYANLLLTMTLGGLWHGAAWNFILWGLLHGVALSVNRMWCERPSPVRVPAILGWAATMLVVFAGWFLFRCQSWTMVQTMIQSLANFEWDPRYERVLAAILVLASPIVAIEAWQRVRDNPIVPVTMGRWSYAALNGTLLAFAAAMFDRFKYAFIYFQF